MSEAMQTPMDETINYTVAAALRHAADCVEELVEAGEPMLDRQTYRRGFNAADQYLTEWASGISGEPLEKALDEMGEIIALAHKHGISGKDAATFYRTQADEIEP